MSSTANSPDGSRVPAERVPTHSRTASSPSEYSRTIMLVDDEPAILKALQRELGPWSRQNKHRVLPFASAKEALAAITEANGEVDLLVTDLRMPEMGGSDLLQIVREKWPELPAILLTGFADTREISRAVRSGLFGFILKPWEPGSLIGEFEKALLLGRSPGRHERLREYSSAEIELAGRLQRAILDVPSAADPAVPFAVLRRPHAQCGGDFHHAIELAGRRLFMAVGEFPARGMVGGFGSSLLKTLAVALLSGCQEDDDPGHFLQALSSRLREAVREAPAGGAAVTAVLLDTAGMTMSWASAGALPVFVKSGAVCRCLREEQPFLGGAAGAPYASFSAPLPPGGQVVLSTDGLMNAGPGQILDVDHVCNLIGKWRGPDLSSLCSLVLAETGWTDFADDVTILHATIPGESHE